MSSIPSNPFTIICLSNINMTPNENKRIVFLLFKKRL